MGMVYTMVHPMDTTKLSTMEYNSTTGLFVSRPGRDAPCFYNTNIRGQVIISESVVSTNPFHLLINRVMKLIIRLFGCNFS